MDTPVGRQIALKLVLARTFELGHVYKTICFCPCYEL